MKQTLFLIAFLSLANVGFSQRNHLQEVLDIIEHAEKQQEYQTKLIDKLTRKSDRMQAAKSLYLDHDIENEFEKAKEIVRDFGRVKFEAPDYNKYEAHIKLLGMYLNDCSTKLGVISLNAAYLGMAVNSDDNGSIEEYYNIIKKAFDEYISYREKAKIKVFDIIKLTSKNSSGDSNQNTTNTGNDNNKQVNVPVKYAMPKNTKPVFEGGSKALKEYTYFNLKYPERMKKAGIQGTVVLQCTVDKNGKIIPKKVLKSVHSDLDAAAINFVKNMPNWIPATINGKPVGVMMTLPVTFQLN